MKLEIWQKQHQDSLNALVVEVNNKRQVEKWAVEYYPKSRRKEVIVRPAIFGEHSQMDFDTGLCTVVFENFDIATKFADGVQPFENLDAR